MYIMNGKECWNSQTPGDSRYKAGHPVVAVDKVRFYMGYYIVDNFPLERQGHLMFFGAVT
jgi:hypothetical protein